MHDFYDDDKRIGLTDLTWIGNENTTDDNEIYICSDCNISLIEKADDKAHLGLSYNRWICPSCLAIIDPLKQDDIDSVKHNEQLHTLTDSNDSAQPHVYVVPYDPKDDLEFRDILDEYDRDEADDFVHHGQIVSTVHTVTKSSVDGRTLRQDYDVFEQ